MFTELNKEMISVGIENEIKKLEKLMEGTESKEVFKVYIKYENYADGYETEERFVFYTENESLARGYHDILESVVEAFDSTYGEMSSDFYTACIEKCVVYDYVLERCPFCGEPVDRRKGWYCPNCGST